MGQAWHWALLLKAGCSWDERQSFILTRAGELFPGSQASSFMSVIQAPRFRESGTGLQRVNNSRNLILFGTASRSRAPPGTFSLWHCPFCNSQKNKSEQLKRSAVIMIQSTWLSFLCTSCSAELEDCQVGNEALLPATSTPLREKLSPPLRVNKPFTNGYWMGCGTVWSPLFQTCRQRQHD